MSGHHLLAYKKEAGPCAVVFKQRRLLLICRRTDLPFAVVELQRRVRCVVHRDGASRRGTHPEKGTGTGHQREPNQLSFHFIHLPCSILRPRRFIGFGSLHSDRARDDHRRHSPSAIGTAGACAMLPVTLALLPHSPYVPSAAGNRPMPRRPGVLDSIPFKSKWPGSANALLIGN